MPHFETKFDIREDVLITQINRAGVIKAIIVDSLGLQYQVHYWDNSQRETVWLFGEELEPLRKKNES